MHKGLEISAETEFKTARETLLHEFTLVNKESSGASTSLIAEDAAGNKTILCTLVPGVNESIVANLVLQPGEWFKLSTSNDSTVHMSYLESENETEPSESSSLISLRVREHEKVLLTGSAVYTVASIVSCGSERLSLCMLVNGEEVTLANLVPNKIESAEISLETFEDEEFEIFVVGKGEVELVGYVLSEDAQGSDEEDCSECGEMLEECACSQFMDEEEMSAEINDNEFLSDDKMESILGVEKKEKALPVQNQENRKEGKKLSKEEKKKAERLKEQKEIRVVDVFKAKNKQIAKKTDKIKIRYTLYVNNKLIDKNKAPGLVFRMGDGQIVRGLELGIEGMTVGSKRTITIPPHLGYGSTRVGGIPPNSTLVFQVELCSIVNQ